MLSLFEHVFDQLHPIICRLASHHVTERDEILRHSDILLLWGRVITFGRHLKHPSTGYLQRLSSMSDDYLRTHCRITIPGSWGTDFGGCWPITPPLGFKGFEYVYVL